MLKKYSKRISQSEESKIGPSIEALRFIIDYSKAIEGKRIGKQKMIFQLN